MPNPGDFQRDNIEFLRNQAWLSSSLSPGGHKAPAAWKTSKASSPSGWEASLFSPINSLPTERFPNVCGILQIRLFHGAGEMSPTYHAERGNINQMASLLPPSH